MKYRVAALACCAAVACLAALGCGASAPAPSPPKAKVAPPAPVEAAAAPVTEPPADAAPAPAADNTEPPVAPPPERPPAERIAILTPGGPLLIDLRLTVDGVPLGAPISEAPANDASADASETPDAAKTETTDDNEQSADDEADKTPKLVLRTSRAYTPDPRVTSRVWALLDANADGILQGEEVAAAEDRLWLRDANDDRVIAPAELAALRDQIAGRGESMVSGPTTVAPSTARLAALRLEPETDAERLDFILQDLYAPRQNLGPHSFTALPELFSQLDDDADGVLRAPDLARLRTVPAHLEVNVSYSRAAPEEPVVTLALERAVADLETLAVLPDRASLMLAATRLDLSAHDLRSPSPGGSDAPATTAAGAEADDLASTITLMVHDRGDALFHILDANGDGRLGEREAAGASAALQKRDADGDGRVAQDEAPYTMIAALLREEPTGSAAFTMPPAAPRAMPDHSPEWFTDADLNDDGDVSRREFVGAAERFEALDEDGDGYLDPREARSVAADSVTQKTAKNADFSATQNASQPAP